MDDEGNGHGDTALLQETEPLEEVETQEELQSAHKKLSDLVRGDGRLISMSKEQLGLLKQFIHAPESETDSFISIVFLLDFVSEDERQDVVNAYYEAKALGMDTKWNMADALSRAATNRKGAHVNSRVATIGDIMSHQKQTSYTGGSKKSGYVNPKSPLQ